MLCSGTFHACPETSLLWKRWRKSLRHKLPHRLNSSSKSYIRLSSSCDFSVLLSRSTFFVRIYIFCFCNNTCSCVLTECSRFVELQCFEQVKKEKFYDVFCAQLRSPSFALQFEYAHAYTLHHVHFTATTNHGYVEWISFVLVSVCAHL